MIDYKVEIKIKNGRLSQMMDERGVVNASELARQVGSDPSTVGRALNLSMTAYNKYGQMRIVYSKLCEYFMCEIDDICPPDHFHNALDENRRAVYVNKDQLRSLETRAVDPMLIAARDELSFDDMIAGLPERRRKVVTMRLKDGMTFSQIAEEFGFSHHRAISLFEDALWRLRAKKSNHLAERLSEINEY